MADNNPARQRGVKRAREEENSGVEIRTYTNLATAAVATVPKRHTQLIAKALASHWVGYERVRSAGGIRADIPEGPVLMAAKQLDEMLHSSSDGKSQQRYGDVVKRLVCALHSHPVLTIGLQGGFTTPESLVETTLSNSIGHLLALAEAQSQLNLISPTDQAEAICNPNLAHNLRRVKQLPALETQLPHILTFLKPADLAAFGLVTRLFLPIAWSDVIWHALLWRDLGPLQPKFYEWKRGALSCVRTGNSSFSSLHQPAINLSHLGVAKSRRHRSLYSHFQQKSACPGAPNASAPGASSAATQQLPQLPAAPAGAEGSRASAPTAGTSSTQQTVSTHAQNGIKDQNVFLSSFFSVPDSYLRRRGPDDSFRDVYKCAHSYVAHKKSVYNSASKLRCNSCGRITALRRMKSQMLRTVQYAECVACCHAWTISVSDGGVKDIIRDMFGSEGIN